MVATGWSSPTFGSQSVMSRRSVRFIENPQVQGSPRLSPLQPLVRRNLKHFGEDHPKLQIVRRARGALRRVQRAMRPGKETLSTGKSTRLTGKEHQSAGKETFRTGRSTHSTGKETFRTGKSSLFPGKETFFPGSESWFIGFFRTRLHNASAVLSKVSGFP